MLLIVLLKHQSTEDEWLVVIEIRQRSISFCFAFAAAQVLYLGLLILHPLPDVGLLEVRDVWP